MTGCRSKQHQYKFTHHTLLPFDYRVDRSSHSPERPVLKTTEVVKKSLTLESGEARGGGGLGTAQSQIVMSALPPQRPLRESLFWSAVVIAVGAVAAVVLYYVTSGVWL